MVHPKVGDKVPDSHVCPAEAVPKVGEGTNGKSESDIRENDILGVFGVEDGAAGIKVVYATPEPVLLTLATALALALVEIVSGDVGQKVVGPADELLEEEVQCRVDGSLFTELTEFLDHTPESCGLLLACSGKENHVTLDMSSGLVVGAVGKFPAEIGNKKSRVDDPAGEVVDECGRREGAVATFVSNDPQTGSK